MKQGDLDAYIAEYEVLVEMARYNPNSQLTLKIFTDSLPTELYKDAMRLDQPRNYAEWKEATLTRQQEWIHLKHRSEQKQGVNVKKQPSQDVLHGDMAEEELGLARLVSRYTLPHQNSQPGKKGRQTARSKVLSRRARNM